MTDMLVTTPELLWHGGGDGGKPDPVLSVDIYGNNVLATSGIDANIPPKGSVRLWKMGDCDEDLKFLVDLSDHQSVVNAVRFSPCGRMIASASDRQIVVYYVPDPMMWATLNDPKMVERIWLRPCLQEIYDICWSPDSKYIVAGSIDSKGEILRATGRDSIPLRGHTSYVQGVAWDPMNSMVVTQSADRSCRVIQLKHRGKNMVKLASKGQTLIRMTGSSTSQTEDEQSIPVTTDSGAVPEATPCSKNASVTAAGGTLSPANLPAKATNLFADSSVPCFFRRPAFTPDGSLLITPTGLFRPSQDAPDSTPSFATHIFRRGDMQAPAVSLTGLEDPSVAVRCSPVLYRHVRHRDDKEDPITLFKGDYRMVFAVVSTSAVFIYDTQHIHPLARIGGCHLATINDAAWSADGNTLVFCSSDGYVSFVRLALGTIGEPLDLADVPTEVQNAFPSVYLPPMVDKPTEEEQVDIKAAPSAPSKSTTSLLASSLGSAEGDVHDVPKSTNNGINESSDSDVGEKRPLEQTTPNVLKSSASSSGNTASGERKKKRITPFMVSPLSSSASTKAFGEEKSDTGTNLLAVEGASSSTVSSTPAVVTSSGSDLKLSGSTIDSTADNTTRDVPSNVVDTQSSLPAPISTKKVKKRIAPMLVSSNPLPPQP